MAASKSKQPDVQIDIPEIVRQSVEFVIVGTTPLVFNKMSEKAKRDLLLPSPPKNAAAKKASVKHEPIVEFRESVYQNWDDEAATLLEFPSPGIKGAMAEAAKDLPGSSGRAIDRQVRVEGYRIPIYGAPLLWMTGVRMADRNRTPDIRTRAIIPSWASVVTISFVVPLLNAQGIANLLTGAGQLVGIGDFRQEKGAGDFGLWRVTDRNDPEFKEIVKQGGRKQQREALDEARPFDSDSDELLTWWHEEMARRG